MLIQKFDSIIRNKVSTASTQEIDGIDEAAMECLSLTKKIALKYAIWWISQKEIDIKKIIDAVGSDGMNYEELFNYWIENVYKE